MKYRIAIWAAAGFLVASGWAVYLFLKDKDLPSMTLSTTDMLILVPLIPLAPIFITWWLPWERWIPWDELPKGLTGLYLLYGAFAAWHFKLPLWFVVLVVLGGAGFLVAYVREKLKDRSRSTTQSAGY